MIGRNNTINTIEKKVSKNEYSIQEFKELYQKGIKISELTQDLFTYGEQLKGHVAELEKFRKKLNEIKNNPESTTKELQSIQGNILIKIGKIKQLAEQIKKINDALNEGIKVFV